MRNRYSIFVGLIFAAIIAVALIEGVGSNGGTLGLDQQPPRWPLPEFAVPVAVDSLEGDANIDQDNCASSRLPCPSEDRRPAACEVPLRATYRICDRFDLPLVVSFWFGNEGTCVDQQDVVSRVHAQFEGFVNFLSVNVGDDRDYLRQVVRERRWGMSVGYDRDGGVASLYHVGGCPTFAYVYPGGTLQSASIGELDDAELTSRVLQLLHATRDAERG